VKLELDDWLPRASVRIAHAAESSAPAHELWKAAMGVRIGDTGLLGRLVRWRIPGTPAAISFHELFRSPPFIALHEDELALISGMVGRIWTLRRDYPRLSGPEQFRGWSARGTARVLFANWVQPTGSGGSRLSSEARVEAFGTQGRLGLAAVRPLIGGFHHLVRSDGLTAAVRIAEGGSERRA
jgi:hypothetical protein